MSSLSKCLILPPKPSHLPLVFPVSQPWVTEPTCSLSLRPPGGGEERHSLQSQSQTPKHGRRQATDTGCVGTLTSLTRAQVSISSSSLRPEAPSSESYGFYPCFCHHPAAPLSTHSPGPDQALRDPRGFHSLAERLRHEAGPFPAPQPRA